MTPAYIATRMKGVREQHAWSSQKWGHLVSSDENKWNRDRPDGVSYYWYEIRDEERILSQRQHGAVGVMIWAAFCAFGFSQIAFLQEEKIAQMYTDTLEKYLVPLASEKFAGSWKFQEDNA